MNIHGYSEARKKTHDALTALCFLMENHVIKDKVKAQVHKQQKQQHLQMSV